MLYDSSRKTPVSQVFTDREGVYTFAIHQGKKYRVAIQKKGFHASPLFEYDETDITSPLVVALMPQGVVQTSEGILQAIGQSIIEYGFEVALVITFVLEVFFMLSFGIEKVLPYFAVSLFSLLVYSLNHKRLI